MTVVPNDMLLSPPAQGGSAGAPVRRAGPVRRRAPWLAVVALLVFSLALAARLWNYRRAYDIFIDEATYAFLAQSVADGEGAMLHGKPFTLHPPMLYWLLRPIMLWSHPPPETIDLVLHLRPFGIVVGALNCVLVAVIIGRLTQPVYALAFGAILALDPFLLRFDGRLMLESPAMMLASAGMLALTIAAQLSARNRHRILALALVAGVLFGASVLVKETYVFVTVVPVLLLAIIARGPPRYSLAGAFAACCTCYALYLGHISQVGMLAQWWDGKSIGVRRLLGLVQETGFNQAGHVGFSERLIANLSYFPVTYIVIGLGFLASLWLLWRELRRVDGRRFSADEHLAIAWGASALGYLCYAVPFGTLEEQMFYMLVVTATPTIALALAAVRRNRLGHRRGWAATGVAVAVAAGLAVNAVVTVSVHRSRDDAYPRLVNWAAAELPSGARVSVTDDLCQFLLKGVVLGQWRTLDDLRRNEAEYLILSTELVRLGYTKIDSKALRYVEDTATVAFRTHGRTNGDLVVYQLPQWKRSNA